MIAKVQMKSNKEQIFQQIKKAKNILITASVKWNEEVIPCSLALQNIFKEMDKKSEVVLKLKDGDDFLQPSTDIFSILPGFNNIKKRYNNNDFVITLNTSKTKIDKIRYKTEKDNLKFFITPKSGMFSTKDIQSSANSKYDLIIILGTVDLESLGELYDNYVDLFYKTPIINIDNQASNEEFGQINLINLVSSSVSEIIFQLFYKKDKNLITENVANCILAGIIYNTKNFKINVTPKTLTNTSKLISLNADKNKIVSKFYKSFSIGNLKLWGKTFNNLKRHQSVKTLVWTTIYENDFINTNSKSNDLINLLDEININLVKVEVLIIFYESRIDDKLYSNALIRCNKNINLKNMILEYKSDYHDSIIQIRSNKSIDIIKKDMIKNISALLEKEID